VVADDGRKHLETDLPAALREFVEGIAGQGVYKLPEDWPSS